MPAVARLVLPWLLLLAACTAIPPSTAPQPAPQATSPTVVRPVVTGVPPTRPVRPPTPGFRSPQIERVPGLEPVLEQDAAGLALLFGAPRMDVREGDVRKLQFSGSACVLDVFLYPLGPGAEPVATYAEARRASDGADVDRAACVAALSAR